MPCWSMLSQVDPFRVLERAVLMGSPFAEEDGRGILAPEVGGQGLLEGPAKEHGRAGVFLLPAVEVAVAVAPRAGEVLADLGVAVGHQATSELVFFTEAAGQDSSSHWLAGAKPSKLSREVPLTVVWLILTTPRRPERAFSSTSSLESRSGS